MGQKPDRATSPPIVMRADPSAADIVDTERLVRLRSGDDTAFEELFRAYFARLAGFAYLFVRSRDVASELAHDVFLALWARRDRWEPAGTVQTYLFRAVRNRALHYLEHDRVEAQWMDDVPSVVHPPTPDQLAGLEAIDLQHAYERAVGALPPRAQVIYRMSREQEMTYADIANVLEISVNTVETQMRRSLMRLRAQLAPYVD